MRLFVEWASTVNSRKGRMIAMDSLGPILQLPDPGYSSIYMFDENAAKAILADGNSKGLDRYPVCGKYLVMDIDSGQEGLDYVEKYLKQANLSYEVWSSGGKGFHIYIPHEFVQSQDLPNSHKLAAVALIPDAESVIDMSLYQAGRLLSLPGRVHPKTRKKKLFMKSVAGNPLKLTIIPRSNFQSFSVSYTENPLSKGLERLLNMSVQPPAPGNRHTALWGTAKDLAESGLDYNTVLTLMQKVNNSWKVPKSQEEVAQAVEQAFKTLS